MKGFEDLLEEDLAKLADFLFSVCLIWKKYLENLGRCAHIQEIPNLLKPSENILISGLVSPLGDDDIFEAIYCHVQRCSDCQQLIAEKMELGWALDFGEAADQYIAAPSKKEAVDFLKQAADEADEQGEPEPDDQDLSFMLLEKTRLMVRTGEMLCHLQMHLLFPNTSRPAD